MNQSAIDIEFLTESGADHYIESVTAAAHLVVQRSPNCGGPTRF